MGANIEELYKLNSSVFIVQVQDGNAVCWVDNIIINENEIVIGIKYGEDQTRLIHPSSISTLHKSLQNPSETVFLEIIKNKSGVVCPSNCVFCKEPAEDNEEVILLSSVFGGVIDPWIHISCCEEFIENISNSIEEHYPEIVSHSL